MTRTRRLLINAALMVAVAAVSITIALLVTPMQQVSAAGQTVQVGVSAPSWSFSGPGELDLFGQQLPTTIEFIGPVRPRLRLTHITLPQQIAEFNGEATGHDLERALVRGWWHYFYWQLTVVALVALVLLAAVSGWRYGRWRRAAPFLLIGVLFTEAINLGAIMTTVYTAPQKLSGITSLQALVGGSKAPITPIGGSAPSGTKVVVIGDSTAAGKGDLPLPHATAADRACDRSVDAYAVALANATGWQVTNLACSDATIAEGLLGPQQRGSLTLPPQLTDPAVSDASTVIVSIGANDVNWTDILLTCAVSTECDNNAEQAYFQQQLAGFSREYLQLITQLQLLPNHPRVLINQYYAPISEDDTCLSPLGITDAKRQSLLSRLDVMNKILAKGAKAAGFATVKPNFAGHGTCSAQPYVQGVKAAAPFHPTAAGELAIALADAHALQAYPESVSDSS